MNEWMCKISRFVNGMIFESQTRKTIRIYRAVWISYSSPPRNLYVYYKNYQNIINNDNYEHKTITTPHSLCRNQAFRSAFQRKLLKHFLFSSALLQSIVLLLHHLLSVTLTTIESFTNYVIMDSVGLCMIGLAIALIGFSVIGLWCAFRSPRHDRGGLCSWGWGRIGWRHCCCEDGCLGI